MASPGPGHVVTELVAVCDVVPRLPVDGVLRSCAAVQVDLRDAGINVGPGEEPVEAEALLAYRAAVGTGWCGDQAERGDRNAVPVVVKGSFVDQGRANGIRGMHNAGVGRIAERVPDRRDVGAAPHGRREVLRDLLRHEVAKNREFAADVMV